QHVCCDTKCRAEYRFMQRPAIKIPLSVKSRRVDATVATCGPISRTYEFSKPERRFGGRYRPLMFAYWGRRGALSQLSLDLAHTIAACSDVHCTISVSKQNEQFGKFDFLGDNLFAIDTYNKQYQALMGYMRLCDLRRNLTERLQRDRTRAFVSLIPHI